MKGIIRRLVTTRNFGFVEMDKADYFFHRDDFNGHWVDLIDDMQNKSIEVEFEPQTTSKGLRARNVRRLDGGVIDYDNQSSK